MRPWILLVVLVFMPAAGRAEDEHDRSTKKQKPADVCEAKSEEERRKTDACKTDEERREDEYERRRKEAEAKEHVKHSSFLKWMHVDGLWAPTSLGASTFGLVGAHIAVANVGRVYFYGPPGFMLLVENNPGGRTIRPSLTWGVGIHLTEFRVPGMTREARLFLSLAKCWTMGDERTGLDMAGLSVTWAK